MSLLTSPPTTASSSPRTPLWRGATVATSQPSWTFPRETNPTVSLINKAFSLERTNFEADVSSVAVNLTSAPELRVFVSPVSSVSSDRWSGPDFVGDSLV